MSAFTRRRVLSTGIAACAAAAFPIHIRAARKSGLDNPILGTGDHRYECIHDFLKAPEGLGFGDTHGLAQDAQGRIYLAHTVHPSSSKWSAVAVFDGKGAFLDGWGESFRGGAHGLDLRKERTEEFLYHCDTQRRLVVKTNLKGEVVWQREHPKESGHYESKEKYCPTNVAFLPSEDGRGDLLVGDGYGSSFIHRYTADGEYKKTIIKPGKDKGKVSCPHGLWIDGRSGTPKIAVADRGNRRIQYFTLEGEHLGFVTEGIRAPCHFKTRGEVMLVPDLESVVTLLDKDNKVIVHLGDGHPSALRGSPRTDFLPGKFIHPHTAIFLANGDILVAEWVPIGRVSLLRKV